VEENKNERKITVNNLLLVSITTLILILLMLSQFNKVIYSNYDDKQNKE
jgi:hypothetical protein